MLLDALIRRYYLARNSLLVRAVVNAATGSKASAGMGLAADEAPYKLWDGTKATDAARQQPYADIAARFDHSVQVSALDGTDVMKVQATLFTDGTGFTDVPVSPLAGGAAAVNMSGNGIFTFTGAFAAVRAARVSGTGIATQVSLLSQAR